MAMSPSNGPAQSKAPMTKPEISGIAPFFIVKNVPTALSFYRDRLGFEITFQGPDPDDLFRHRPAGCRDDHAQGRWCRSAAELQARRQKRLGPLGRFSAVSTQRAPSSSALRRSREMCASA